MDPIYNPATLNAYPTQIRDAQVAVLDARQELTDTSSSLERRKAQYTAEAANIDELTNETKRKAYVANKLENDLQVIAWQDDVTRLERELRMAEIKLEHLRNTFSVAKLLIRQSIAFAEPAEY